MATKFTDLIKRREADIEPTPPNHESAEELNRNLPVVTHDPFDKEEKNERPAKLFPNAVAVMLVIVLDVSGSLWDYADPIRKAFAHLFDCLRKNGSTRISVDVLVVTFANEVKTFGFAPVDSFAVPELVFGGMTNTAAALDKAREEAEARLREYAKAGVSLNRVIEVIITDGQPTCSKEAYATAIAQHRAFEAKNKRVEVFPVAAGAAAMPALAELSVGREPLLLDRTHWEELFDWIYRSSVTISGSIPGGKLELPPVSSWATTRTA